MSSRLRCGQARFITECIMILIASVLPLVNVSSWLPHQRNRQFAHDCDQAVGQLPGRHVMATGRIAGLLHDSTMRSITAGYGGIKEVLRRSCQLHITSKGHHRARDKAKEMFSDEDSPDVQTARLHQQLERDLWRFLRHAS